MEPFDVVIALAVAIAMFFFGWLLAHETVEKECQRLGAFYVGSTVYECHPKEHTDAR